MNDFLKKIDKNEDSVRAVVRLAAFLGTNMVAANIGKMTLPLKYGPFRKMLYSYGLACLSVALGDMAANEAASMYDATMNVVKKYNSSNEGENFGEEKEVMVNEEDLG